MCKLCNEIRVSKLSSNVYWCIPFLKQKKRIVMGGQGIYVCLRIYDGILCIYLIFIRCWCSLVQQFFDNIKITSFRGYMKRSRVCHFVANWYRGLFIELHKLFDDWNGSLCSCNVSTCIAPLRNICISAGFGKFYAIHNGIM